MEQEISQEQLQDLWKEEAKKLDADAEETASVEEPIAEPQEAAPAEPIPAEPEDDPFAGVSPAVREKLAQIDALAQANAQLLHHVKTAEGRVAAMQREFQQAKTAQQSVAPQDAPSQGQIATAAKNPEKWEQLKSDFPEWAGAMEEYVASKLGGIAKQQNAGLTSQQVEALVAERVNQTKAEVARQLEEARIEGKHDDWRSTVNTPEFAAWYSAQPPEIRSLADSTSAKDAIRMLDLYSDAKTRPAAQVRQERGAKLAAAATTRPGNTPPAKTVSEMSPEELWHYEARRREKTRAERGF